MNYDIKYACQVSNVVYVGCRYASALWFDDLYWKHSHIHTLEYLCMRTCTLLIVYFTRNKTTTFVFKFTIIYEYVIVKWFISFNVQALIDWCNMYDVRICMTPEPWQPQVRQMQNACLDLLFKMFADKRLIGWPLQRIIRILLTSSPLARIIFVAPIIIIAWWVDIIS